LHLYEESWAVKA